MAEFLARLKQRKLVQWALAYVAFAFALIQVLDVIAQRFGWPDQIEKLLILALAIGFVFVLVIAWYHGERGAQKVSGTEIVILALLLAIGGGLLWRYERVTQNSDANVASSSPDAAQRLRLHGEQTRTAEPARRVSDRDVANQSGSAAQPIPAKSIAVLPFVNMSGDSKNEYFSDGMSEELLNALAQVNDLKVAGRTSSFYYKGRNEDLRTIGKALGVANILEGSVRKQGNEVRITAQLIRVADDTHLWSHAYDGDLSDVFKLQEEIARAITDQLQVVLVGAQKTSLVPIATTSTEAYTLYLKATDAMNRRDYQAMGDAIGWLNQAIQLDPNFARAQARLAMVNLLGQARYGASRGEVAKHAQAALALDPGNVEAQYALGRLAFQQRRYLEAHAILERAVTFAPSDASAHLYLAQELVDTGYTRQGIAHLDRALAIDPLLPNALYWRGRQYLYAGDLDRAERLFEQARNLGLSFAVYGLAPVAYQRGDRARARALLLPAMIGTAGSVDCPANPEANVPIYLDGALGGDAAARAKAVTVLEACLADKPAVVPALVPFGLLRLGQPAQALAVVAATPTSDDAGFFMALWGTDGRDARRLPDFAAFAREVGLAALWDKYGPPDMCKKSAAGDYLCQ